MLGGGGFSGWKSKVIIFKLIKKIADSIIE